MLVGRLHTPTIILILLQNLQIRRASVQDLVVVFLFYFDNGLEDLVFGRRDATDIQIILVKSKVPRSYLRHLTKIGSCLIEFLRFRNR